MRKRETHINLRTTPQEKKDYLRNAKKCGLSLSEYLRKLAGGYEPREAPRLEYAELIRLLCNLYAEIRTHNSPETERQLAALILQMQNAITPQKTGDNNGCDKNMAGA